jgi:hypothetical protein
MAKYRGKYDGNTRGKYKTSSLLLAPNSREKTSNLEFELIEYFSKYGFFVDTLTSEHEKERYNVSTYHYGGSTVSILSFYSQNGSPENKEKIIKENFRLLPYYICLKLVSNDQLNDVLRKIKKTFPDCRELD